MSVWVGQNMKQRSLIKSCVSILLAILFACPLNLSADQAQYFYDELGRLVGVMDGQGEIATYEYDAVGNVLSITRGPVTAPSVSSLTPDPIEAGLTIPITITGTGLLLSSVTASNPDIQVGVVTTNTETTIDTTLVIPNPTTFGMTSLTVTVPGGSDATTFTINQPVPIINQLSSEVRPLGATITIEGTGFGTVSGSNQVTFPGAGETRIAATVSSDSFTNLTVQVPAGTTFGDVTVQVGTLTSAGVFFTTPGITVIPVTATVGVPADLILASTNALQNVQLVGQGFVAGDTLDVPALDQNGVSSIALASLTNISPDGTTANVIVPATATTGLWVLTNSTLPGVPVQIIPTTSSIDGTVTIGGTVDVLGSGFQEGATTVLFPGAVGSVVASDVLFNNDRVTVMVPPGVTGGTLTVMTPGGTSNGVSVGIAVLVAINSVAQHGTPLDPNLPSANPGTNINLEGLGFESGLDLLYTTTDHAGVQGTDTRAIIFVSADGITARAHVLPLATTGLTALGTGSVFLQIVPLLSGVDSLPAGTLFEPGTDVIVRGGGLKEGVTSLVFEGAGAPVLANDVFSSNSRMSVTIPPGVSLVTPGTRTTIVVVTDGGTSRTLPISHPLLTSEAITPPLWGTPQNPLEPAANLFQSILLQGQGLTEETRASIHTFNSSGTLGTAIRNLDNVSPDGTSATVAFIFGSIFTGPLTVFDNNFGPGSGSVPLQIVPAIRNIVGPVSVGGQIEIQGFGFDPNITEVQFPGVPTPVTVDAASVVSSRGSSGTLTVPSGFDPTGSVTVLTPGGSSDPFDLDLLTVGTSEIEPNNTSVEATRTLIDFVNSTSENEGRIDPVADVDFYRIDVDSSGGNPYDGVISLVNAADPPLTLRVTGLANDGTVLFTEEGVVSAVGSGGPGTLSFGFAPPGPGRYFLKVEETTGQGSPVHAYQMNIQFFFPG